MIKCIYFIIKTELVSDVNKSDKLQKFWSPVLWINKITVNVPGITLHIKGNDLTERMKEINKN